MAWVVCITQMAVIAGFIVAAQTESLSGGAGWVGAGLLGLVLSWLLLVHLPAKDKLLRDKDTELRNWIDAKDKQLNDKDKVITDLVAVFRQESKEIRVEFREVLGVMESHFDRRNGEIAAAIRVEFERLGELLVKQQTGHNT